MDNTFPIDFDALRKGDMIEQSKIESIYLVKFKDDPNAFRFSQMRLMGEIRSHRRDLAAHVKTSGNCLEILSDEQAEDHTRRQFEQSRTRITTVTRNRASIDRSAFEASKLSAAESQDRLQQVSSLELRKLEKEHQRDLLFRANPAEKAIGE